MHAVSSPVNPAVNDTDDLISQHVVLRYWQIELLSGSVD